MSKRIRILVDLAPLAVVLAASPSFAQEVPPAATGSTPPVDASAPADDAAPDEGEAPRPEEHGDPTYAVDVEAPADEVVRSLFAAARAGDVDSYRRHLADRFLEGVAILQAHPGPEGAEAWSWSAFLGATSADIAHIEVIQFYERSTVRVETNDGRVLKFRLVVEDGAWKVDLPEPIETLVAERAPPQAADVSEAEGAQADDGEDTEGTADDVEEGTTPGGSTTSAPPTVEAPPVVPPPPEKPQPVEAGFFSPGGPGHYVWYIPDYLFLASSAVVFGFQLTENIAPPWILIGPEYNIDAPKIDRLYDPRVDGVIGRPMLQEKVPEAALIGAIGGGIVGLSALDVARHLEFHHTHSFAVGALTSVMLTLSVTEALKLGVGRLRPDFRERYARSACGGFVEAPSSFDCNMVPDDGFDVPRSEVIDGMKSFPSGHASSSFAAATYFSLYLGGEYLWGDQARPWSMPIAAATIGLLYAGAGAVAATRLSDNRHHPEDVIFGAGLGSAIAAGTYFLHFDLDGNARWRTLRFSATPVEGKGGAVSVSGTF